MLELIGFLRRRARGDGCQQLLGSPLSPVKSLQAESVGWIVRTMVVVLMAYTTTGQPLSPSHTAIFYPAVLATMVIAELLECWACQVLCHVYGPAMALHQDLAYVGPRAASRSVCAVLMTVAHELTI